jgi:hypothetical protein
MRLRKIRNSLFGHFVSSSRIGSPAREEQRVHRRWIVRLALLLSVLLVVAPGAALAQPRSRAASPEAAAASQLAAVGCTGTACNGLDPQTQGCSPDGRDLEEFSTGYYRVELRYSNACVAAWTRTTGACDAGCTQDHVTDIRGYGTKGVLLRKYSKQTVRNGTIWTKMIGNNTTIKGYRSCLVELFTGDIEDCTPLHAA